MEHLKTYEGFFDIFKKKKLSEDDEIAQIYINRLKKVKGISPYDITLDTGNSDSVQHYDRFTVYFDDTQIVVSRAKILGSSWHIETRERWKGEGGVMRDKSCFYKITIDIDGDKEILKASPKKSEELFELVRDVYRNDIEAKRINKIRTSINPAADLIDGE